MTKLTAIELKGKAQEMILLYGQVAFNKIEDLDDFSEDEKAKLHKSMDKEFARIEKLFGYEQGSWGRGV